MILLLLELWQASGILNVILVDQTSNTPVVQTHNRTCRLNGQTVAHMGENKAAFAEDPFDVNGRR
jgi:hypothetical protein